MTATRVTSTTVEASATAAVEAPAKARLPARRESSGDPSMIKAAERARAATRLSMGARESVLRG